MFLAGLQGERYTILCMGYKYFDAGPNGETGKDVDKLYDQKRDANLQNVFRYPLCVEGSGGEDEVEIPAVPFHIVQVGLPKIHHRDDIDRFSQLLSEVPHNLHLILDLHHVSFVDNAVFSPLVNLYKSMRGKADIFLVNVEKAVLEKFQITKLDTIFHIRRTTHEAYEEIQKLAV